MYHLTSQPLSHNNYMASPSHLRNSHTLQIFSMKSHNSSSSPSTLSSMKIKTLIHTLIFSHLCRVARALSKSKSILAHIFKEIQLIKLMEPLKRNKNKNKLYLGSFRLHYNWCNNLSHVLPAPGPVINGYVYYDASWDTLIGRECDDMADSELSGYLQWLENRANEKPSGGDCTNEIDKLADKFIANSHEKFILEKQESLRMFQEMMARSV